MSNLLVNKPPTSIRLNHLNLSISWWIVWISIRWSQSYVCQVTEELSTFFLWTLPKRIVAHRKFIVNSWFAQLHNLNNINSDKKNWRFANASFLPKYFQSKWSSFKFDIPNNSKCVCAFTQNLDQHSIVGKCTLQYNLKVDCVTNYLVLYE